MITQDLYPHYDSFQLGIQQKYMPSEDGDFYIHIPNILTHKDTISLGYLYVLMVADKSALTFSVVEVIDVFVEGSLLNIILSDVNTEEIITIKDTFDSSKAQNKWYLFDEALLKRMVDTLSAFEFCTT